MSNILDYMKWRDIKLENVEFNEVDNLILSRLAYFPFDDIIMENEEVTIKEVYKRYEENGKKGRVLQQEDNDLFPVLADSIRFGNLILSHYVNKIDIKKEKQFSAITIILPDNTIYVAYRGTDNTIIGWKEDFNMSFSDLVESQTEAVKYLEEISSKYDTKIRVGGHSKGGNLAVYASAFCSEKVKNRIINVYNNDGPGFCDKVIQSKEYKEILNRVHTYIPQTSIIGRLLNHEEETTILLSTETGIMQHDLYSWQVLGDKFVKSNLTNSSEFIDKTITDWLKVVGNKQREEFIDTLFAILEATGAETMAEISNQKIASAKVIIKEYKNVSPETKEMMIKVMKELMLIGKNNLTSNFFKIK